MKIPKTNHTKIRYRNGKTGLLLTTERKNTEFKIMTIRDNDDSIIHHLDGGGYSIVGGEHELDIVEIIR